jgi:FkbM family methyltransferase
MLSQDEIKAVVGLFPFLREDFNVIDVGSNKGHWADLFVQEFKERGRIILFEPNDMLLNYTRIKYEYQPNIWYDSRVAYRLTGIKLPFHYFENYNNELSSIYDGGRQWEGLPQKTVEKTTITLDDYCAANFLDYIDIIKIDCEGADLDVLKGCCRLLAEDQVGVIQIEYSQHWQRSGATFQQLKALCDKYGYQVYFYEHGNYWKIGDALPHEDLNLFITKFEIANHSTGWNKEFISTTLALREKFDLVLEIGAFEGLSTLFTCKNLLNEGNPDARVIVVDPLEDHYVPGDTEHPYFRHQYQRFQRNTRGLPVELKRGRSQEELPKLNALRFGFIFIDGDHYPPAPYFDGSWAFAICKPGGYILFDDYEWRPQTKESIDKFLNEFAGAYDLIHKGYQVLIRKVTNRYNELTHDYYK